MQSPTLTFQKYCPNLLSKQSFRYLGVSIVYLLSNLPGLSWLFLVFSLPAFLYWSIKRNHSLAILILILGSSYSFYSKNLWNNGYIPALPVLLLVLSLAITKSNIRKVVAVTMVGVISLFSLIGMDNILVVGIKPYITDLLVIATIFLTIFRFAGITEKDFIVPFAISSIVGMIKLCIFAATSAVNPVLSLNSYLPILDSLDELMGIYLVQVLLLILWKNKLRYLSAFCFLFIIGHAYVTKNWVGYYGFGSQVFLVVILYFIILSLRVPLFLISICAFVFGAIPLLQTVTTDSTDDLKIQQLLSLIDIAGGADISLLPHSVHVRVAEITTFFSKNVFGWLFGGGVGGFIPISDSFPKFLGTDDFNDVQLLSGLITSPHNLGYLFVKFGLIGSVISIYFVVWVHAKSKHLGTCNNAFYVTAAIFLILNIGYTLKISFLIGLLIVILSDNLRLKTSSLTEPAVERL